MRSFDSFLIVFSLFAGIGGALVLLVQFLSLRMRNSALPTEERDPHLGRKFALGVFLHLSVLLLLTGLTVSMTDIFDELIGGGGKNTPVTAPAGGPWGPPPTPTPAAKPFFNSQQRVAAGLMLSGVMHGLLFGMLYYFATNARKFPVVSRAFVINRLLIAGVILMSITTSFCVMLFSDGDMMVESFGRVIGLAMVWGPAALGHFLWLMFVLNRDKLKAVQRVEVARPRERDEEDDRPRRRGEPDEERHEDDDRPREHRRREDD